MSITSEWNAKRKHLRKIVNFYHKDIEEKYDKNS